MTKRSPRDDIVKPGATIRDVDLDSEVVRRSDGTRLTNAVAEQIVEDVLRKAGRPSLSSSRKRSPQLGVRVSDTMLIKLHDRAAAEGKKVSEIVRDAIEKYV